MSNVSDYEDLHDREFIDIPEPTNPPEGPPTEDKAVDTIPPYEFRVTTTIVETFVSEEAALAKFRQYGEPGHNTVTMTKGNKIVAEKSWGHFADKHGSRQIGPHHKVRILVEE